jgi:heme/copper-type cytochrome/quinol oxidase subunit 2
VPVRRKALVLLLALGAALALTTVAYAGNGGFAPLTPHSPNAKRINDSYLWISIFTGAIFVLVEGALIVFVVKYRRRGRPRTVEGPQIHGATRLELIWTAVPVLILAAIAAFIFYKPVSYYTSDAADERRARRRAGRSPNRALAGPRSRTPRNYLPRRAAGGRASVPPRLIGCHRW